MEDKNKAQFIPYPETSTSESANDRQIVKLLIRYFKFHSLTEYTELTFLVIGIVYFLEAIYKNTIEMIKGHLI